MSPSDLRTGADPGSLPEREEFLRRILASSDDCIKILTLDARLQFMSENGRKALAIPDFELVRDADWLAFWHGDDRRAAEAAVIAATSGVKGEFEGAFVTMAGEPKWFHVVVSPMFGASGRPEHLLAVSRDVTRAHRDRELLARNAERLALLVGAGNTLASSLDYATTLENVARLAVRTVATFCFVDLIAADGSNERVAWAHADDAQLPHMTASPRFAPRRDAAASPVARVIASGEPFLAQRLGDDDLRGLVLDDEHYAFISALDAGSALSVPLVASGRVLGALTMCLSRASGRTYDESDVPLMRDLANRAAVAIEHARLYTREHQVATALQEAALPRSLPDLAGASFDAEYLPGKSEALIGGDWYDAFALRDGRVVVSIGDVVGSGLHAAVTMTKIRETIRTAALTDPDPGAVLAVADVALALDDPDKIATALVGVFDPRERTLTCAAAGHPSPLVHLPGGEVADPFDLRALPLGLRDGVRAPSRTVTLQPGAFVAFFTDGLIESTHDALEGERRLRAALADSAVRCAERPARALRVAVIGDARRDDVAILTLALTHERE
jgi:PAS domain S-box-containing protein